jgi:hypothetical protein
MILKSGGIRFKLHVLQFSFYFLSLFFLIESIIDILDLIGLMRIQSLVLTIINRWSGYLGLVDSIRVLF